MSDSSARSRLRAIAAPWHEPEELADSILGSFERMESISNRPPKHARFRKFTGLTCSAEFRGRGSNGAIEDAITSWLPEFHANAAAQVRGLVAGSIPDVCFGYARDACSSDVVVVGEAKPVWQRWITTGERVYSGVVTDEFGRSTGKYAANNVRQVVQARDKLLRVYTDPRDRLLLLALVFQRPDELDQTIKDAVGSSWNVRCRHVVDLCNPPGDAIGMTGMVFWPRD